MIETAIYSYKIESIRIQCDNFSDIRDLIWIKL